MVQILWEYTVKPEQVVSFETNYASAGTWAALFQKSSAYRGTVLLRDSATPNRYVTIDVWTSRDAYEAFRREHAAAYEELDRVCAALTVAERHLGTFDVA